MFRFFFQPMSYCMICTTTTIIAAIRQYKSSNKLYFYNTLFVVSIMAQSLPFLFPFSLFWLLAHIQFLKSKLFFCILLFIYLFFVQSFFLLFHHLLYSHIIIRFVTISGDHKLKLRPYFAKQSGLLLFSKVMI